MRLDDLIALARERAASNDPLEQLGAAARLKEEVDDTADALLGHFVDQARRAGCSWAQIGTALGVSKQAAQQKHRNIGFRDLERFTDRARKALGAAEAAARGFGHPWVGTEHLLLGLSRIGEGVAEVLLTAAGLDLAALEAALTERFPATGEPLPEDAPVTFTPRAFSCLEQSVGEALKLGHNYVGTEHLLLALAREGSGIAAEVLAAGGLDQDAVRARVVELLTSL